MIRFLNTLFAFSWLLLGANALGATETPISLSLDDAIARAMVTNPRIQALEAGTLAQESQAQSEKNRWLGELMLSGGVALNGDDTLIRPISSEIMSAGVANMPFDDRYAFWSLAYRLPLFTGGTVSGSRDATRLTAVASRRVLGRSTLEIRHQVLKTYASLLSLDAEIEAWQAELAALDGLLRHIQMGREAGKYSRVDLLKTQVQQQSVLTKNQALRQERQTQYAILMALIGETSGENNRYDLLPLEITQEVADTLLAGALVDSALVHRSDLKALKDLAAAQRFNAGAVGGSRWPQVSLGGNFSGTHGGSIDFDDTFWSVNATVSLPLLDMGRRNGLTAKANQTARQAELNVVDLESRIRTEVIAARAAVVNSRNNWQTQLKTLELAEEISRLEQLRYDSGRGDIDNLLQSLAGKSTAEAAVTQSSHNLLIALNNLQLTIEGDCR